MEEVRGLGLLFVISVSISSRNGRGGGIFIFWGEALSFEVGFTRTFVGKTKCKRRRQV